MSKTEIASKLDEIVSFSGCEMYIDTPVKRYSSGMIVRLGFSVAAHLDPEILIVDEVLAVGDAEFQDKCIGKMKDISGEGRTILFVSHNMATMKSLCEKGFLMDKGRMVSQGSMTDIIDEYLSTTIKSSLDGDIPSNSSSINTGKLKYKNIKIQNSKNESIDQVNYLADINVQMVLNSSVSLDDVICDVRINSRDGIKLIHCMNKYSDKSAFKVVKGNNLINCKINNQLQPGNYTITIGVHDTSGMTLDFVEDIIDFKFLTIGEGENAGFTYDFKLVYVHFDSKWSIEN
jgi:lipopolysaccharide transport system ATP-binding protein